MATKLDVARLLDGESSADAETRHGYALGATVRNGTATGDSSNGWVAVLVDGSTASVTMRTDVAVKTGERGTVISQGGTCKFIPLESMGRASKDNAKAIEEAQKTLKQAQDDLAELDEKLYGDGTDENPGAMKQLDTKLGELDGALGDLDDDLHGKGGLDDKLADLNTDLATLNTDLYGEDGQSGKLGELDDALADLNTDLYGDGTEENPGKLAELDADLDPDNKNGAMGKAVAKANAAAAAAKTAKETADGKNKVYAQSSQPSGTFVQGDLWRKLDSSGNIVGEYVWNGSAWVKHALTADALLVASIVAADAFIKALQTNKLTSKEVDAGDIVTRELLAEVLKAKKLTAEEVSAGSIVTKAVISEAVKTDKLDSNEINVNELAANEAFIKTLVAADLFAKQVQATKIISDFLEANKVAANQIDAGAVTTDKLGAEAVTAAKINADEMVANEAFAAKFTATTAFVKQLYAELITANKITANQLISVNDNSYAQLMGAVLELFDGDSNSLSKLAATYADFCSGQFRIEVSGNTTQMKNAGTFSWMSIDPGGTLEVKSNARIPGVTLRMNSYAKLDLTSDMQVVPMAKGLSGYAGSPSYLSYASNGLVVAAYANVSVSGFAEFREVSAGQNCVLALYYGEKQIAYAISSAGSGGYCTVAVGPVMYDGGGEGSSRFTLRARTGGGGGYIGWSGSDSETREADLTAALTVAC